MTAKDVEVVKVKYNKDTRRVECLFKTPPPTYKDKVKARFNRYRRFHVKNTGTSEKG